MGNQGLRLADLLTKDGMELDAVLRKSAKALREVVAGVSDQQAQQKINPDCWSILGIVEHVALVDTAFSGRIAESRPGSEELGDADREYLIRNRVSVRGAPLSAPVFTHPQDRFATMDAALTNFDEARSRVRDILRQTEDGLRHRPVTHPAFGVMSAYEAFLLIAAHTHRHINQIREIQGLLTKASAARQA